MTTYLNNPASCSTCAFTTRDLALLANHSCDVAHFGGNCEDFPACGHEYGDCNGLLYGSDESIVERAREHFGCEHEHGFCVLDDVDCGDEDCAATGTCIC